jgi:MFS family permease
MAGPADPETESYPPGRAGRRLLWLDGLVSNISDSFVTSFVNPFAMAFGATNSQIGLLSAVTNLASALGLLPGAQLEERYGHRKLIVVLTGGGAGRLLLLALALLPLFVQEPAVVYGIILVIALRAYFGQLGYPAWSALVGDLVPKTIRGRYFAARNIGLGLAALIFTPLAGRIIELGGGARGYQIGFAIAAAVGLVATGIFARIPEPPIPRPAAGAPRSTQERTAWAALRARPRFVAFTAVAFLWNLALMTAGPFFSVYLVRHLYASPTQIGILAAVNATANIVGQRIWGRLNDRRGAAWVMRITGLLIPLLPLLWSVAPGPWYLLPVEAFSGFVWAGYGLSSFNLLLGLTPEAQRARFVAVYQLVVFGAACGGPLLGSLLADTLTIRPLFWISGAGRLIAALLFLFTVRSDKEATDAHEAQGKQSLP